MACFFGAGNFLGVIFLRKFRGLTAGDFVFAAVINVVINLLFGIPNHSKFFELLVSFFESLMLVLGVYSALISRFNQPA